MKGGPTQETGNAVIWPVAPVPISIICKCVALSDLEMLGREAASKAESSLKQL